MVGMDEDVDKAVRDGGVLDEYDVMVENDSGKGGEMCLMIGLWPEKSGEGKCEDEFEKYGKNSENDGEELGHKWELEKAGKELGKDGKGFVKDEEGFERDGEGLEKDGERLEWD